MKLVIVRHLMTEWNQQGRLQGSNDISILEPDEAVLQQVKENLAVIDSNYGSVDLVLTSLMRRTQQTAEVYGFTDYSPEPLLNELNFGKYEGQQRSLMLEELGEAWFENPQSLVLGESLVQLQQRIVEFFKKYDDKQVVLAFGHGSWIRAALSIMQYGDLSNMNKVAVKNNQLYEISLSLVCN